MITFINTMCDHSGMHDTKTIIDHDEAEVVHVTFCLGCDQVVATHGRTSYRPQPKGLAS